MFTFISWIFILSSVAIALYIYYRTFRRPEPMRIMNAVWIITGLWGSFVALFLYRKWSRDNPKMNMSALHPAIPATAPMPINRIRMTAPMYQTMKMPSVKAPMMMPGNRWQSVAVSALHCGAGCAVADVLGEGFTYFLPLSIGGSLIAGSWTLDFVLALILGVFFQYMAIEQMQPSMQWKQAVGRAVKADVLSLTAWQIGMYGWMALCYFVIFNDAMPTKDSAEFWFLMQIAMWFGFMTAFPVNYLLIKWGVKKAM